MVFLRLMGGMGNQMFQYAMARTLCLKHNCELMVDTSLMAECESVNSAGLSLRPFELDVFNIKGQIASNSFRKKNLRDGRKYILKAIMAYPFRMKYVKLFISLFDRNFCYGNGE